MTPTIENATETAPDLSHPALAPYAERSVCGAPGIGGHPVGGGTGAPGFRHHIGPSGALRAT